MRRCSGLPAAVVLTVALISMALISSCGDGNSQGLRHLTDEVQGVRTAAEQGDLNAARQQLDDLRVTAGVLRGRGRITAEDLIAFRVALDRVEAELGSTQQSLVAAAATTAVTTTTTTTVAAAVTTEVVPPTTEPPPPAEWPGKRKGQDEDD
jgi:hypothetical protein